MTDLSKCKHLGRWPKIRQEIEQCVLSVLGTLSREQIELQVKIMDEDTVSNCTRRRVNYFVDDWTRISAWVFIPNGHDDVPALLCCHDKAPQGKAEPAGIDGDSRMALARRYAELGYVTIAPDCITAGERRGVGLAAYDTSSFYKYAPECTVLGKMLWDHILALDVLTGTKRVDAARVGVIGHGLGGVNALLLAAFDTRVQVCVASSAFTRFADDKHMERWVDDEKFSLLPTLTPAMESGSYPFDWEHILALIAPIPTLLITDQQDPRRCNVKSNIKAVKLAGHIYKLLGEQDALECFTQHGEGVLSPDALEAADDWLARWI